MKNILPPAVLSLAALSLLLSPHAQAADTATAVETFRWVDTPGVSTELRFGDRPVVRYMHTSLDESTPEKRAETYKPYLHVFSPDGERLLTKGAGGLFPHHRGIFFGMSKVTYGDGKKCDTWHCKGKAYQSHEDFVVQQADEKGGVLVAKIVWHGAEGEPFAGELRGMKVTGAANGMQIDFQTKLEPIGVDKIHLDGDPQHAGVQFRAAQQVAEKTKDQTYYLRTDGKGKPGETRNWDHNNTNAEGNDETTNRPWLAMSSVLDGERYTVLYIDHPQNPKPARYSERDYGRFGSYFVADVTKEKPLELKYRYFVKTGEMTVEECQTLCDEFVAETEE